MREHATRTAFRSRRLPVDVKGGTQGANLYAAVSSIPYTSEQSFLTRAAQTFPFFYFVQMNRLNASGIHFLISLCVGVMLFGLLWFIWYPAPSLIAIGGHELFLLIVGIDVILGPLLTLVVFDTRKRSLKYDLAVIALLQMAALAYGVSVMLQARPAYIAANGTFFQVVQATEVTAENLKRGKATLPRFGPRLVGTKAPQDLYEKNAVADVAQIGGGRGHFPQLHIPYEAMAREILANARPLSDLVGSNPKQADEIRKWIKTHDSEVDRASYQPMRIRASEFVMVIDAKSAAIIGIAPFTP